MHVVPYIEEATLMILEIGVPGKDKKYVLTSRTSERCAFSGEMSSGLKNLLTLSLVDSGSASLYDLENLISSTWQTTKGLSLAFFLLFEVSMALPSAAK